MSLEKVRNVFQKLDSEEVPYVVVRNWQDIDSYKSGGLEIDILVEEKNLDTLVGCLLSEGFLQRREREVYDSKYYYGGGDHSITFHVHIDCINYNNIPLIDSETFMETRKKRKSYYIPREDVYVAGLVLHSIFDKHYFKEFYKDEIERYWEGNEESIKQIIKSFSEKHGEKVISHLEEGKYSEATKLKWRMINEKTGLREKLELGALWFKHQKEILKSKRESTTTITFLGVTGSGKTTATEIAEDILEEKELSLEKIRLGLYHSRTLPVKLLSKLYVSLKRKKEGKKDAQEKKTDKEPKRSLLQNLVVLFDMKLRELKAKIRITDFLITDRHYFDVFTQSQSDRKIRKAADILNSSDLLVLLYHDSQEIVERREKIDEEEVEKKMERLESNLQKAGKKYIKLRTDSREKVRETSRDDRNPGKNAFQLGP